MEASALADKSVYITVNTRYTTCLLEILRNVLSWIQSVSGRKIPLLEPDKNAIHIEDIAHSLSMLCRFNGHGLKFYSVAEHSVHVSYEVEPKFAMTGLLHDASEAYLGDIPSPLKKHLHQFKIIENRMMHVIAERFSLPWEQFEAPEIKRADIQLLVDEKAALMVDAPETWPPNAPAAKSPSRIMAWSPSQAKEAFIERFQFLEREASCTINLEST